MWGPFFKALLQSSSSPSVQGSPATRALLHSVQGSPATRAHHPTTPSVQGSPATSPRHTHTPYHSQHVTLTPCPPNTPPHCRLPPAAPRNNKSDNKGLISADRNNKATLLLTIPRCTSKSYTNDLSSRKMTLQSAGKHPRPFRQGHRCQPAMVQRRHKGALFVSIYVVRGKEITAF